MAPLTKAGKSSSQLIAIIQRRDSILPEPTLTPLVPERNDVDARAYCRFLDSCAKECPELLARSRR